MKEPLASTAINAPDGEIKRHAVEERIDHALNRLFADRAHTPQEHIRYAQALSFVDKVATAYTRYRFAQMDGEALLARYEQIPVGEQAMAPSGSGSANASFAKDALIEKAEAIVDAAIDAVYKNTKTRAGHGAQR